MRLVQIQSCVFNGPQARNLDLELDVSGQKIGQIIFLTKSVQICPNFCPSPKSSDWVELLDNKFGQISTTMCQHEIFFPAASNCKHNLDSNCACKLDSDCKCNSDSDCERNLDSDSTSLHRLNNTMDPPILRQSAKCRLLFGLSMAN